MNTCRRIESLVYLYRGGELSTEERVTVDDHVKTCSRCREILGHLLSMDNALAPLRDVPPQPVLDTATITDTVRQLSKQPGEAVGRGDVATLLDALSGFLRPALSLGLIAAALLFIAQESRDALNVAGLERRLQTHGDMVTQRQSDLASLETFITTTPAAAAVVGDPSGLFASGLADLFRHNPGLFEDLGRRYPNLSGITLSDGVDEHERTILETEGKAFIKEFEQLTRKGAH